MLLLSEHLKGMFEGLSTQQVTITRSNIKSSCEKLAKQIWLRWVLVQLLLQVATPETKLAQLPDNFCQRNVGRARG